jgi:hypothetical protein
MIDFFTAKLAIDHEKNAIISIRIPIDAAGQTLHIVCEVSDQGPFNLTSYQRVIIVVTP